MRRVTGIGGVFFKAKDPEALGAWYRTHLGLIVEAWGGVVFRWSDDNGAVHAPRSGVRSRTRRAASPRARRPS